MPHQLTVELQDPVTIKGFSELPRQDNQSGRIAHYRIEVSDDGQTWRQVVEGNWPNTKDRQSFPLPQPVRTRFIRLDGLSEVNGQQWIALSEFDIIPE